LTRGRYIDAVHSLQRARTRFSRAERVRELRREIGTHLRDLHDGAEEAVGRHIAEHDFKAARNLLTKLDHVLADRLARRDLIRALGDEPREFRQLYEEVERKELTFNGYVADAREAVLEFDFKRALRTYTTLETEFPSEKNVPMLEKLRRGPGAYSYAMRYPEHVLKKVIADPGVLSKSDKIRLKKVHLACLRLIDDFDPEEYPTFEKVRLYESLTKEACDKTLTYVNDRLLEAKHAEDHNLVFLELKILKAIENIVTRSDLFDVETRQRVVQRHRDLDRTVRRAESYYTKGCAALAQHEYVGAQVSLAEVSRLVPEGYKDSAKLLERLEEMRSRLEGLSREVASELTLLERRRFDRESAIGTLRKAADLYRMCDDAGRENLEQRLATACTAVFDVLAERSLAQPYEEFPRFLSGEFLPVVAAMSEETWEPLLTDSPDLCRSICGVLSRGYAGREEWARGLDQELDRAMECCDKLKACARVLKALRPPLGSSHPSAAMAQHLMTTFERARRPDQDRNVLEVAAALKGATALAPAEVAASIRPRLETLASWGFQGWASRNWKYLAGTAALILLLAGLLWLLLVQGQK
jgi:hypothetical protein